MKRAIEWLINTWHDRRRGAAVAGAYQKLLHPSNPAGRLVLLDLAEYCNARQTSFVAGDPYQTALNEGRRDVFCHLTELAGLTASDFQTLLEGS